MKTTRNLLAVAALALSANAGADVMFSFNDVVLSGNAGAGGMTATGGNSAIRTSMLAALAAAGYSGVGVTVSGALATNQYNGEGHVVGPTLGSDTFVMNNGFGIGAGSSNSFTLTFTGLTITSISFDWEIFPNADCQAGSYCATHTNSSSFPDLTVNADSTQVFHAVANLGSSTLDPQAIGSASNIGINNATSLTFIDWPAEIGIDNLRLVTTCPRTNPDCGGGGGGSAPEPASLALIGLGMGAMGWATRRRRDRSQG